MAKHKKAAKKVVHKKAAKKALNKQGKKGESARGIPPRPKKGK